MYCFVLFGKNNMSFQDVGKILVGSDGAAKGVVLKDGTEVHSQVVLSNATPHVTFKRLTPQVAKINDEINRHVHIKRGNITYSAPCFHCRQPFLQSSSKL